MFDATPDPPPLVQSAEFEATLRSLGQRPRRLADGTLVLRRRVAGLPLALVSRARIDPNTLPWLLADAGLSRAMLLLNPETPVPLPGALPLVTPAHVAELDLTGDLHARLHQKWRNRLAHARRHSLHVAHGAMPDRADHWLLAADAAQGRARRYRGWPAALTLAYARATPGAARLFTAQHQG
ncbi:GNAT family N-acetyltransferase, partial [Cribrihabitans sp. XS_ASV171]